MLCGEWWVALDSCRKVERSPPLCFVVQGDEIGKEVRELVRELPGIFRSVVDSVSASKDVGAALEYYRQFLTHVHTCDEVRLWAVSLQIIRKTRVQACCKLRCKQTAGAGANSGILFLCASDVGPWQKVLKGVLPCLTALREDTSAAECSDEEAATALAASGLSVHPSGSASGPDSKPGPTIDWGISSGADSAGDSGADAAAPAIDWGVTLSDASGSATVVGESTGPVEIDWGFSAAGEAEGAEGVAVASKGIDWGIDTASGVGENSSAPAISWDIDTGGTAAESGAPQAVMDWGIAMEGSGESTESQGEQRAGGAAAEGEAAAGAAAGPRIVWDFSVNESGEEREAGGSVPSEAEVGKGSTGDLAASKQSVVETAIRELSRQRLARTTYRSQLLDDLCEVRLALQVQEGSTNGCATALTASCPKH